MESCFVPADILLPQNTPLEKWAVIACDQFTSDRQYWDVVRENVADVSSTFSMVFPEIDLNNNALERIASIRKSMQENLEKDVFTQYPQSFIYVERTLLNGVIRPGVIGAVDLEQYHYDPRKMPTIGATEQTVLERVPPRIAIRREAELEFSHVILFCNDIKNRILKPLSEKKMSLKKLYDFELMQGGGHISGWLINGDEAEELAQRLLDYQNHAVGTAFLVADGNHSLVTAKCWYEELKQKNPNKDLSNHPARYALVELENILDPSINFEPIHRVIFQTDAKKLLSDMQTISGSDGCPISWIAGNKRGTVTIQVPGDELPVAVLQRFLDRWLAENPGVIDYVHDTVAVENLAKAKDTLGLLLPAFDKEALFAFGAAGKILPRKTFSLGHSREKRYYLEGRKIR